MKKPVALLLLVVATAATVSAQSSVWKVTAGDRTLYVGGTCHVLRASDFPLPAEFDTAYAAAQTVIFECDTNELQSPAAIQAILAHGVFADGQTLDQVVNADTWAAIEKYCGERGVPVERIRPLRPWFFIVTFTALELQGIGVTQEGADLHYARRAQRDDKQTNWLETVEQQIEFLTTLGAGHENELIQSGLRDIAELPTMFQNLLAAWRAGDMAKLDALMVQPVRADFPSIHRDLIVKRNQAWLPSIEEMLQSEPIEFVLVGAAHLAGPEGVLEQLKQRGHTVEQIVASKD